MEPGSPTDVSAAPDWFAVILEWTSLVLEGAGVAVIVVGAIGASIWFVLQLVRQQHSNEAFRQYRTSLARGILLGLEFLVAADIIGTVAIEPNLENLAVLAGIVAIRTFLSFSLEVEIEGRWPWQRKVATAPSEPAPS